MGAGHLAEYLVFLQGQDSRHTVLAYTGDSDYLSSAVAAAALVLLLTTTATFATGVRRGLAAKPGGRAVPSHIALPIAQALTFGAIEVGERLMTQGHLPDVLPVMAIGLPLQLLVGWLFTFLIVGVSRAGEHLGQLIAAVRLPAATRVRKLRPASWTAPCWSLIVALEPTRGPPSLSSSNAN